MRLARYRSARDGHVHVGIVHEDPTDGSDVVASLGSGGVPSASRQSCSSASPLDTRRSRHGSAGRDSSASSAVEESTQAR